MQTNMLLTCCYLSLYIMHVRYNIIYTGLNEGYHALTLLPPLLSLVFVLPHLGEQ